MIVQLSPSLSVCVPPLQVTPYARHDLLSRVLEPSESRSHDHTHPHTQTHASPSPLRAFAIPLDREPASELRPFPEITTVSASHLSYNGHIEGTYSPPFLVLEIWERDKGIEKQKVSIAVLTSPRSL